MMKKSLVFNRILSALLALLLLCAAFPCALAAPPEQLELCVDLCGEEAEPIETVRWQSVGGT